MNMLPQYAAIMISTLNMTQRRQGDPGGGMQPGPQGHASFFADWAVGLCAITIMVMMAGFSIQRLS